MGWGLCPRCCRLRTPDTPPHPHTPTHTDWRRVGGPPASALHKPHGPETWQQHNDRRSHCRDGRRGRRRGRRGGGGAQRGVRHAGGACGCGFVCRWDGDCARVVAGSARPTHHRIHTPPRTQTGGVSEDHLPPRYISPMARRLGSSTTTAAATAAMEDAGGGGGEGEGEERNEVSVMPGVRVDVGLCVDGMGTVPALLPAPHARHTTASTHPHAHRLAACRRQAGSRLYKDG